MTSVQVGFHYSRIHDQYPIPAFAGTLEGLGFDSVWLPEGLVNEVPVLDIMMGMSAFVHHSERLTVGAGVVLLPLRHPAVLAKEVSTLDRLSGGRVILGIGVGGPPHSNPAMFDAAGVSLSERGARTDESLAIMTKLFTGKPVSHHGRFYHFDDIYMVPEPVQRPRPPFWTGGTSEGMLRRTARWGDGYIPVDVIPAEYRAQLERIRGYADEIDRDVTHLDKALHLFCRLGRNREEARGDGEAVLNERRGFEVTLADDGRFAFGTPSDFLQTIEPFIDLGVHHIVFNLLVTHEQVMEQLELLTREVIPRIK